MEWLFVVLWSIATLIIVAAHVMLLKKPAWTLILYLLVISGIIIAAVSYPPLRSVVQKIVWIASSGMVIAAILSYARLTEGNQEQLAVKTPRILIELANSISSKLWRFPLLRYRLKKLENSLFLWVSIAIVFLFAIVATQILFFEYSIAIWLLFLFVLPWFLSRVSNQTNSTTLPIVFWACVVFGFVLVALFDNARDTIAEKFISDYTVSYKEEVVRTTTVDGGYDYQERDIAYVDTKNDGLDWLLQTMFTPIWNLIVIVLLIISFRLNVRIRKKVIGNSTSKSLSQTQINE